MTARFGGAYGRGYTPKGESVVELPSEARQRAQKERIRNMARKNAEEKADVFSATPGARGKGVHTVEQPLQVGPRDALIEDGHNDGDYVPDVESKGYHVGMVRQPVSIAADERGNVVGFTSELPSKFEAQPTIADLKAKHNADEAEEDWFEGTAESVAIAAEPQSATMFDAPKRAATRRASTSRKASGEKTVGDEIADAADGE